MIRRDVVIAILATFCLTATLLIVLPTRSSPRAGEYDSWADINEDGKINMYDIGYTAQKFGAAGDPTKNVNVTNWPSTQNVDVTDWPEQQNVTVTNWPIAKQETVFYNVSQNTVGSYRSAKGFSHIHLTWSTSGLVDPESITIRIWAFMDNPAGGGGTGFWPSWIVVTSDNYKGIQEIPVPSELFGFSLYFPGGTTANVYLSYYLTYA